MRAAILLLLVTISSSARAENAVLGDAQGPWFVGASGRYVHDGRRGYVGYWQHDGVDGSGGALEAGRTLRPWISVALIGRLAYLGETIHTDPGLAQFTERQLSIGPRVDFWPLPGRIRLGAALLRRWQRKQTHYDKSTLGGTPEETVVDHEADMTFELQAGVVPLRWHGYELEVNASYAREPGGFKFEDRSVNTFTVGLGLRWRTAGG